MHAPLSPTAKILFEAANILREGGHCKGMLANGTARCAMGAIMQAAEPLFRTKHTGYYKWSQTVERATISIENMIGVPHGIVAWNNAPERTADEVIEMFERAALAEMVS